MSRLMRYAGSRALFRLLFSLVIVAGTAHAATFYQFNSQPGDYVGMGESALVTPGSMPFDAHQWDPTSVDVTVGLAGASYRLHFGAPGSQPLAVGAYEDARWLPGPATPSLDIVHSERSCGKLYGRFTILEVVVGAGGIVSSFAADFEEHCNGAEAAIYGGIRYNSSIPYVAPTPPPVGPAFLRLASQPGDYIGQGGTTYVDRSEHVFWGRRDDLGGVYFRIEPFPGQVGSIWSLLLSPAPGQPFGPGVYEAAQGYGINGPGHPAITLSGDGRGCNVSSGRFIVHELEFGPIDTVKKLAVDFEQHCNEQLAGLYGALRFNSNVPDTPPVLPPVPTGLDALDGFELFLHRSDHASGLRVRVHDEAARALPGALVNFRISDCGSFEGALSVDVIADSSGIATPPLFFAPGASTICNVYASLPGVRAAGNTIFSYWIYAPEELILEPLPSQAIVTDVNQAFRVGVKVSLINRTRANVPVRFATINNGQAGTLSLGDSAITGEDGIAYADAVANSLSGSYAIAITVEGVTKTVAVSQRGTASSTQHVTAPSPAGFGTINAALFTTQASCTLAQPQFYPAASAANAPPAHFVFPYGLASFRAENCGAGQGVDFVIDYPQPLPPNAVFWRFGPTPDNRVAHWYPMPGATVDSTQVRFRIVDGELGDDDLVPNGSIGLMGGVMSAGGIRQDMWWAGPAENGWGMSVVQHGDALFSVIYAYDASGNPTWFVMPTGTWNSAQTAYSGALYSPRGSPFFAYDASRFVPGSSVGVATLTFTSSSEGILDYTIGGVSGRKNIKRQAFGAPTGVNEGTRGDMWWGGIAQNGWGVAFLHQFSTLFNVWFTYDVAGVPTWYVMPGGNWTSTDVYEGRIYRTTGSPWVGGTYDAAQLKVFDVGAYRARFTGESAALDYTIDGRSGSVALVRQAF